MADYVRTKQYVNGDVADGTDVGYEFDALGANVNLRLHANGSVPAEKLDITYATPTVKFSGTESTGEDWRIREAAGLLLIQSYNGATWDTIVSLPFVFATDFATLLKVQANDLLVKAATPAITLEGTETSGVRYRWYENAGVLKLQYATIALPTTWVDILEQTAATGAMTITGDLTVTGDISFANTLKWGSLEIIDLGAQPALLGTTSGTAPLLSFVRPGGTYSPLIFVNVYFTGTFTGVAQAIAHLGEYSVNGSINSVVVSVVGLKPAAATCNVHVYALSA